MPQLSKKQIQEIALKALTVSPTGLQIQEAVEAILKHKPSNPINSIRTMVHNGFNDDENIVKISRGLYSIRGGLADSKISEGAADPTLKEVAAASSADEPTVAEKEFYEPFATWLVEQDEATNAKAIGGHIFGGKWNTPDVLGVLKPRSSDRIRFEPQIVSAELKVDKNQPVVAFGQAISYRLFSHKSYVVLPDTISKDDLDRLTALATIYGLGLVTFKLDPANPEFLVQVRAATSQPDMFYVNQMATRLAESDRRGFGQLF